MNLTGRTTLKIWVVLVAVFLLGSVTGAAVTGLYRSRASAGRNGRDRGKHEQRFERMRQELSLTDQQAADLRTILDQTRNEYRALREELRPRFEEPRMRARTKIRALLNAEQQKKFDALVAQQDAEHKAEEKR